MYHFKYNFKRIKQNHELNEQDLSFFTLLFEFVVLIVLTVRSLIFLRHIKRHTQYPIFPDYMTM